MTTHTLPVCLRGVLLLTLVTILTLAAPARAQDPDASASVQEASHDDAKLRPAEPDFTIINLPTTLPLPVHGGDFHLTHRFGENLLNDSFSQLASNLFGIDEGATIEFGYRFGVMKHLEAIAARTNFNKVIQLSAKYDPIHQDDTHWLGLSGIVSVEGANNFQENYEPALGASISRAFGDIAAVYVVPFWVHNSAAGTGVVRDTVFIGLGARVSFLPGAYLTAEVSPRPGGYRPGDSEFAFGVEKRIGGHVFSLVFANMPGTTFGQLAAGGFPHNLQMGFNLTRKFF